MLILDKGQVIGLYNDPQEMVAQMREICRQMQEHWAAAAQQAERARQQNPEAIAKVFEDTLSYLAQAEKKILELLDKS